MAEDRILLVLGHTLVRVRTGPLVVAEAAERQLEGETRARPLAEEGRTHGQGDRAVVPDTSSPRQAAVDLRGIVHNHTETRMALAKHERQEAKILIRVRGDERPTDGQRCSRRPRYAHWPYVPARRTTPGPVASEAR